MDHLKDVCKLAEAIAKDAATTKHKALSDSSSALKDKLTTLSSVKTPTPALPIVREGLELTKAAITSGGQKGLIGRFLKPKKKKTNTSAAAQLSVDLSDLAKGLSLLQLVIFSHLPQDISTSGGVSKETPQKSVLWVDDHPENNKKEATAIWNSHHVKVVQEISTKNAKKYLDSNKHLFNLPPSQFRIITDKYREGEGPNAGAKLISFLRKEGYTTPVCIYCSDALEALETQAAHPRVTVATTSALLNVFVQGMLAKANKTTDEEQGGDSEEEDVEERHAVEDGETSEDGKGKGKTTTKDSQEGDEAESHETKKKENNKKEDNESTTTTTTTTTEAEMKEREEEEKEEKTNGKKKTTEPSSPGTKEDEPTQSEEAFQEEEKENSKEKEKEKEKDARRAEAEECEREELERKRIEEEKIEKKRKEDKQMQEQHKEEKRKEEQRKEKDKKDQEEKKLAEKKAERREKDQEKLAEKKAKEEDQRKERQQLEEEEQQQEKQRKEDEKKAKEKRDKEKKEEQQKEKDKKEEQHAKKKQQEDDSQSKLKKPSGSFNSSFSKDSQHKLWTSDKSAASIVPGNITTFFIRHATPKSVAATNPGFEVVVFPSNSTYLLEGFVFPVKAGVFGVKFFPVTRGEYKVSVKLNDEHIGSSPFVLTSETQQQKKDDEEDILDMIDKSADIERSASYDTASNNTSVNTSVDTSVESIDSNINNKNNKTITKINPASKNNTTTKNTSTAKNSTTNTTTKKAIITPNTKNKKMGSMLSPFSFVDHVTKSEGEGDPDDSFGSKEDPAEGEDEEKGNESKDYEPTQALESESDTSFEAKKKYGKKGAHNKMGKPGAKHTELVATQALDDSGAADTEEDSDSEKPGKIPDSKITKRNAELLPTQALDDSRGGDTEEDSDGSTHDAPETAKRKRETTGLSDADTEPDNDSDSDAAANAKQKKSAKKVRTSASDAESLQTLPYH